MSEQQIETNSAAATMTDEEWKEFELRHLVDNLDGDQDIMVLNDDVRLQVFDLTLDGGRPSRVVRYRHNLTNTPDPRREDVYFGFQELGKTILWVYEDDLKHERELTAKGEFGRILPHRETLAHMVSKGFTERAVRAAEPIETRRFLRIIHEALDLQRLKPAT